MCRVRMGERSGYTSTWCDAPHWGIVTEGRLAIAWEDDIEILSKGDIFHCPAGPPGHRMEAADPATFIDLTPISALESDGRLADCGASSACRRSPSGAVSRWLLSASAAAAVVSSASRRRSASRPSASCRACRARRASRTDRRSGRPTNFASKSRPSANRKDRSVRDHFAHDASSRRRRRPSLRDRARPSAGRRAMIRTCSSRGGRRCRSPCARPAASRP